MATCKLDKLGCPPVGESLHRVGHCYCYLCTCGKHYCPSQTKRSVPSLAPVNSVYRRTFVGRHITPSVKFVRQGELLHSRSPMEFKTTGAEAYGSPATPPHPTPGNPARPEYSFRFEARSSYRDQFVDWKMQGVPPKKKTQKPLAQPAKLSAVTSYSRAYNTRRQPGSPPKVWKHPCEISLGVKQGVVLTSTSQQAYQYYSPEAHATRVSPALEEPRSSGAARNHFMTTYGSTFQKAGSAKLFPTYGQLTKARLHR